MESPRTIQCPSCGKRYKLKPQMAGKSLRCPCGGSIHVSASAARLFDVEPSAPTSLPHEAREAVEEPQESIPTAAFAQSDDTTDAPMSAPQAADDAWEPPARPSRRPRSRYARGGGAPSPSGDSSKRKWLFIGGGGALAAVVLVVIIVALNSGSEAPPADPKPKEPQVAVAPKPAPKEPPVVEHPPAPEPEPEPNPMPPPPVPQPPPVDPPPKQPDPEPPIDPDELPEAPDPVLPPLTLPADQAIDDFAFPDSNLTFDATAALARQFLQRASAKGRIAKGEIVQAARMAAVLARIKDRYAYCWLLQRGEHNLKWREQSNLKSPRLAVSAKALAEARLSSGDRAECHRLLQMADNYLGSIESSSFDFEVPRVLEGYLMLGDFIGARRAVESTLANTDPNDPRLPLLRLSGQRLIHLADAMESAGDDVRVRGMIDPAQAVSRLLTDRRPDEALKYFLLVQPRLAYRNMVHAACELGHADYVAEVQRTEGKFDFTFAVDDVVFMELVRYYTKVGRAAEVRQWLPNLPTALATVPERDSGGDTFSEPALHAVIRKFAESAPDLAMQAAEKLGHDRSLVWRAAISRDPQTFERRMAEANETIDRWREMVTSKTAELGEARAQKKSSSTVRSLENGIKSAQENAENLELYRAAVLAEMGHKEQGLKALRALAEQMLKAESKPRLLEPMGSALIRAKMFDVFTALWERTRARWRTTDATAEQVIMLLEAGQMELAQQLPVARLEDVIKRCVQEGRIDEMAQIVANHERASVEALITAAEHLLNHADAVALASGGKPPYRRPMRTNVP